MKQWFNKNTFFQQHKCAHPGESLLENCFRTKERCSASSAKVSAAKLRSGQKKAAVMRISTANSSSFNRHFN